MSSLLRLLGLESGSEVGSIVDYAWRITKPLSQSMFYAIIIIGAVLAAINFLPRVKMRRSVRLWTFLLRLAMVVVLLVIIQQVELHLALELRQKQSWLALLDDSASMATEDVEAAQKITSRYAAARADLEKIKGAVDNTVKLEVKTLSGKKPGEQPGSGPTLIQKGITRAALSTSGIDRLIFLTDGRDTENRDFAVLGGDIQARGVGLGVKLYGSQVPPRDSGIFAEPERAVIRLGEELVIRGSITGTPARSGAESSRIVLLKENGKAVKEVEIAPGQARRFLITHKPARSGRYSYTVELPGTDTLELNNSYTFKALVVEEKIKVFLIEGHPAYEFKLIRATLDTDPMVDLVSVCHIPGGGVYVQGRPLHENPEAGLIESQAELFKYDIVILQDVSRLYFRAGGDITESRLRSIVEFVTKRGGGLVVLGGQDVYRAGGYEDSALMEVLPFDLSSFYSKDAQFEDRFFVGIPKPAYSHPVLRMFADAEKNRERLNSLRRLDGSNNVGRFKPLATPLLTRFAKLPDSKGDLVEREVPVMAYQAVGEGKVMAAGVDTFWRWQLQPDFDDPPLQTLLANIVRYIAPPPQRKPGSPDVNLADASPQVGQKVVLSTTLKDKNYDPIRNAELRVTVARPDGTEQHIYPRDLPEQPGYYEYKVPLEMPGVYDVTAEYGKNAYETTFMVEASGSEYADLSVDREAMQSLAEAADGTVIESLDPWLDGVDKTPSTREVVRDLQIWNSPMALLLFLGLLCADCYIRKRQGLV